MKRYKLLMSILAVSMFLYSISGMYCVQDSAEEEITEQPGEAEDPEEVAEVEVMDEADVIDESNSAEEEPVDTAVDDTDDADDTTDFEPEEPLEEDVVEEETVGDSVSGNTALGEDGLPDEYIPHYREDLQHAQLGGDCGAFAIYRTVERQYYDKYGEDICIDVSLAEYFAQDNYDHARAFRSSANRLIWHSYEKVEDEIDDVGILK